MPVLSGSQSLLLSMTGHGTGNARNERSTVTAEVRSVNNRFLKTTVFGEVSAELQVLAEDTVRESVRRGTVTVRLRLESVDASPYRLNPTALTAYRTQWQQLAGPGAEIPWAAILGLPGVVVEPDFGQAAEELENLVRQAVRSALEHLQRMRQREGAAMRRDLIANLQQIGSLLDEVDRLAPRVVENYAQRVRDRIQQLLLKYDLSAQPADIIREVGLFAERSDIAEEIVRLRSHLQQFEKTLDEPHSNGRKLDFLIQEFLRETNTIGSKAADAQIANCVVEMKTLIERIREMVQNIE